MHPALRIKKKTDLVHNVLSKHANRPNTQREAKTWRRWKKHFKVASGEKREKNISGFSALYKGKPRQSDNRNVLCADQ